MSRRTVPSCSKGLEIPSPISIAKIRRMGSNISASAQREGAIIPTESRCPATLPRLPTTVLEEVLINIPAHEVVRVCRLVCQEWKELVDSASYWKRRCRREGLKPRVQITGAEDWLSFYFLSKKRRNLIKNPRAEDDFNGWQIVQDGGHKWQIENDSPNHHPDGRVRKYFVTSYNLCMKSQLINLDKEGYGPLMDKFQPDIVVSDWYSPRWDCGSVYMICVELLNDKERVLHTFRPDPVYFQQWNDMQWQQMTHVFSDYGPGVRYIRFTHGGKDTQFWAGWYGIRVTNSSVEIAPEESSCLAVLQVM